MSNDRLPNFSNKELIIMDMLLNKAGVELYGWELIESSEGKLKVGSIYVTLNRMEDKGYVESRKEERVAGARGLPKRMYKLSASGHRAIHFHNKAQEDYAGGLLDV